MSSKTQKSIVDGSGLVCIGILLLMALFFIATDPTKSAGSTSPEMTNKALVAKLVKGSMKTVIPTNGETISRYWVSSGAEAQGFDLTAYTRAVKKLNPDLNVNVFRDNTAWKVPWPKGN